MILRDDAPKFDFTAIPLGHGIEDAMSSMTFSKTSIDDYDYGPFEDHTLEANDLVATKEQAINFGGDTEMVKHGMFPSVMEVNDDVPPSRTLILGDHDEMLEHRIFPLTMVVYSAT